MPSIKTITPIIGGQYYHIFNRGINKQLIFFEERNYDYFLNLMKIFLVNYVDILGFCLLPNHFHLLLQQQVDNGIEKFMHRLGSSYVKLFNQKHKRRKLISR